MSSPSPVEILRANINPDGTLTRDPTRFTNTPASSNPDDPVPVLTKDVPINDSLGTWFRIFLPRDRLLADGDVKKLPLIMYYHGGGFIYCSAASSLFNGFHNELALGLPAVIVSVEYRLAPEHRLPAAYDDAVEALRCLRKTEDEWLIKHADFSNCYLMGSSSGGNIALHTGLRVASWNADEIGPVKIRGMILHHTFLGGEERTESELRLVNDSVLPPEVTDLIWQLALPIGADRSHVFCNPITERNLGIAESLDRIRRLGWRILVMGGGNDPTVDRQVALANSITGKGIPTISHFTEGGCHGFDLMEPVIFVDIGKKFISGD